MRVLTIFAPAYYLAANIAGDKAEVTNLLPQNASLHDYTLTPQDRRKLSSADLLILNGAGLESWFEKTLRELQSRPEVRIVRLADGLEKQLISSHEGEHQHNHKHDHGEYNPHLWLDPLLLSATVTNVSEALAAKDPAHASAYRQNAAVLVGRLTKLDQEFKDQTSAIKEVPFLTYHNAFPYLARRYNLKLVGVVEEIPEISPSAAELRKIHQLIKSARVKALFSEPGNFSRLARQIARDGKIELAELDPFEMGELSTDAYDKVMHRNLRTLVSTLSK